jgi:pyrroloquinoline quinone (PQQ) biosynthesis protein C
MSSQNVVERIDRVVDEFANRVSFFYEPMTPGRARTFVEQHRLNTRQRNSVLKLRVATNCPIWDIKMDILNACTQELIADHEHGGGRAHWEVLDGVGLSIGMDIGKIRSCEPLPSTRICWLAWEALMSQRHWLEGLMANTCMERVNVPGYGRGQIRELGWFGVERDRWQELFNLKGEQLDFFELHTEADIEHSDLGWNTVARYASEYSMEDAVVEACRVNLTVWEQYLEGIARYGDQRSD